MKVASEMKLIAMTLSSLLLAGMWLQGVNSKSILVSSPNCCFKFMARKISMDKIQCHLRMSSSCSYSDDGVIFKLKGGRKSCALTTNKWVKDYLEKVKLCP